MTAKTLTIFNNGDELAAFMAGMIAERCADAIDKRGVFRLAVSGGSSPLRFFRLLAQDDWRGRICWEKTDVCWVDERCVATDDPESNFGAACEALFSKVPVRNLCRIRGEMGADKAAAEYEAALVSLFGLDAGELPRFDFIQLGIGADGHTASIFPDNPAGTADNRLAVPVVFAQGATRLPRVTLTLPVLNNTRCCVLYAPGASKAGVLRHIHSGAKPLLPAGMVQPARGELFWLMDREAAALLD
ncbi:6-phosphogluconolactonase [Desulfovibrio sp. OttesenSCG-928-C06]|nr:6-phosphogluconolactonase [Desulfovibrio sp. OttesenSCG-928-C06]